MGRTLRRTVGAAAIVIGLSVAFTGCSLLPAAPGATVQQQSATASTASEDAVLEAYVAAVQAAMDKQGDAAWRDTYSKVTVRSGGAGSGTVEYRYTYAKKVNKAAAKKYLAAQAATLQGVCDSSVFPEMERAGISDPKVRYTYLNANGSKIWSHLFTPSE